MSFLRRLFGRGGGAATTPPLSSTLDLEEPAVSADPYPWYERLRAEGDVVYLPRHNFWIVLGDEAAREVFARPESFSSAPYSFVDTAMLSLDPPLHGPVRRVVSRAFGGETLRRLETEAEALATDLLGGDMEAVAGFARPVSRRVAASLIGLDQAALDAIAETEQTAATSDAPFPLIVAAIDAVAPRAALMEKLLDEGEGIVGAEDALSLVRLLWLASTATTERTIAQCVLRLASDAGLHHRLRNAPQLVPGFVEEVLRLTPPENLIQRRAVSEAAIAGVTVPAGAAVQICLPAANRDPARYEAPGKLRLDRGAAGNLSFGSGIHQCVGGPMTRRVVNAAVKAFVDRYEQERPPRLAGEVTWLRAMVVCAPSAFRVVA